MNGTILAPVLCMRFNVKATISTGGFFNENDDDKRTACRNYGERHSLHPCGRLLLSDLHAGGEVVQWQVGIPV
jgi:hypothetical protein